MKRASIPITRLNHIRRLRPLTVSLGVLFLLVAGSRRVHAHRPMPGNPGGVVELPDAELSYAFYQELTRPDQVDYYRVTVQPGARIQASINIPHLPELADYGVSLALVGPDLPDLDPAQLPASALSRLGDAAAHGLVLPSRVSDGFYEPFTQTRYYGRQRLNTLAPAGGTYTLLVWHPQGLPGKYVFSTGYRERFGPADLVRFPGWWVNVHRYYGDAPRNTLAAYWAGTSALVTMIARLLTGKH